MMVQILITLVQVRITTVVQVYKNNFVVRPYVKPDKQIAVFCLYQYEEK